MLEAWSAPDHASCFFGLECEVVAVETCEICGRAWNLSGHESGAADMEGEGLFAGFELGLHALAPHFEGLVASDPGWVLGRVGPEPEPVVAR